MAPGTAKLHAVLEAIDAANLGDPTLVECRGETLPLALAEGRVAHAWVLRLREGDPRGAPDPLLIAARGHHIRRWETPRSSYPEGRRGYLDWRTHLYDVHADHLEALMRPAGYDDAEVAAMRRIVRKRGIKADPDVQTHEDAVTLAFLELQLAPFAARTPRDATVRALRKTWQKLSDAGRRAALSLSYDPALVPLIEEATRGAAAGPERADPSPP